MSLKYPAKIFVRKFILHQRISEIFIEALSSRETCKVFKSWIKDATVLFSCSFIGYVTENAHVSVVKARSVNSVIVRTGSPVVSRAIRAPLVYRSQFMTHDVILTFCLLNNGGCAPHPSTEFRAI